MPSRPARQPSADNLTVTACERLRDPADDDVLTSSPAVCILVLRDSKCIPNTHKHDTYVTDGSGYAWIALPRHPNLGEAPRSDLPVGAAVKFI